MYLSTIISLLVAFQYPEFLFLTLPAVFGEIDRGVVAFPHLLGICSGS